MAEPFLKILGGAADFARGQIATDKSTRQVGASSAISGGTLVTATFVSGTPLQIRHGLQTVPSGYIVVSSDDYVQLRTVTLAARLMTLEANANATVTLWVF